MNELKISSRRTKIGDLVKQRFFQLPQFLFKGQFVNLNNDARVLYALLLDRHRLSIDNGWVNDDGEVFLYYKQTEMMAHLGISDKTLRLAIRKLEDFGLLSQERQGLNKPNKIYVSTVDVEEVPIGEPLDCGGGNFPSQDCENFRTNKTNYNKTETGKEEIGKFINAHSGGNGLGDFLDPCRDDAPDDNLLEDDVEEIFIPPELDENQRKDKSIIKQAVKTHSKEWASWALKLVDDYIDKYYPDMTGRQHPNLKIFSKAMRMTFAVKILDCMDETSCKTRDDMMTAIGHILKNRNKKYSNINPTIYWLTDPKILGYGILCTHDEGWESVRGTEYEPMQDYFW